MTRCAASTVVAADDGDTGATAAEIHLPGQSKKVLALNIKRVNYNCLCLAFCVFVSISSLFPTHTLSQSFSRAPCSLLSLLLSQPFCLFLLCVSLFLSVSFSVSLPSSLSFSITLSPSDLVNISHRNSSHFTMLSLP